MTLPDDDAQAGAWLPASLSILAPTPTTSAFPASGWISDISLEKDNRGLALQAGFGVNRNGSINLDRKEVQMRSNFSMAGGQISGVKLDPVLFGVGGLSFLTKRIAAMDRDARTRRIPMPGHAVMAGDAGYALMQSG